MARDALDPAINIRDDVVSISFLLFLSAMIITIQVLIIAFIESLIAFVAWLVVAEVMLCSLAILVIRSIRVKLAEKRDKKDSNLFLSSIRQGEFDSDAWYELSDCPTCQTKLAIRDFSSDRAGHLWKMKLCPRCDKIVAKRLIVTVDIDDESSDGSDADVVSRLTID